MSLRTLLPAFALTLLPLTSGLLAAVGDGIGLPTACLERVGVAEAAFIRRSVIKSLPSAGFRVAVVVADDAADAVDSVGLDLSPVDGTQGGPASGTAQLRKVLDNGNKRFVLSLRSDEALQTGGRYRLTSTMRDAAGRQVGALQTSVVAVEPDGDPELRSVTLRQLDETRFELRVLAVADHEGEVASVDVIFVDYEGPAPIPTEVNLRDPARRGGSAWFIGSEITFEDPAAAAGEQYRLVVDLKDAAHRSLGASETAVYVEGLDDGPWPGVCWDGVRNGLETGVDCGGNCSPCLGGLDAIDLLAGLSEAAVHDAAATLGLAVEPGTVGYTVSDRGAVAFTAGTDDGGTIVVPDGFSALNIGGGSFTVSEGSVILMDSSDLGVGGGRVFRVRVFEGGGLVASYSFDDAFAQDTSGLLKNGGAVGGVTPTGVVVYDTALYGDIILGGMRLDDFND